MLTIDGVINLNKPVGITSAKALYRVRAVTQMRKSGHTGTLDPAADGVLVICVGKATKLVEKVMDLAKCYRATARLDVTSESLDSDRPLQNVDVDAPPDHDRVAEALRSFEGRIEQRPPAVSALKIGGAPAYKLQRGGVHPEMPARPVMIYWTRMIAYEWPHLEFEAAVGRGTYVRSLIRDIGNHLGCGGCLTALTRTSIGPFELAGSWDFERMQAASPADYIRPLDEARGLIERYAGIAPPRPE